MTSSRDLSISSALDAAAAALGARRYERAHALCLEVLRLEPQHAEPYFLLGVLAGEHGNAVRAADMFERAIARDGGRAKYFAHLSRAFVALSDNARARAAADRAASLSPEDALTLDTIGVAYARVGAHARALSFLERAVALRPDVANYWYNYAASLQFSGRFGEAADAYRKTIARDPGFYRAYSALVQLSRQTRADNQIAAMEQLFWSPDAHARRATPAVEGGEGADAGDAGAAGDANFAAERALHLGHALAKSFEDMGRPDEALVWLERGKAAKRAEIAYRPDDDRALFEAAAATYPPKRRAPGHPAGGPIFVVGLPRTGTTLVDRILSSHPDIESAGELTNFALIVKRMAETPSPLVLDVETLGKAPGLDLAAVGRMYEESLAPLRGGAAQIIDKMPLNFFYAGLIHLALPHARIICLRRGPLDAALSNYRQLFATTYSYYNFAFAQEDVARYVAMFERLIAHWRRSLPPDRYLEVRYEDIVANQEAQTRRLLAFCGAPWDEACLAFHENAAPVATASSVQVRQPLYASSVGRWRSYGAGLAAMRKTLDELGFPTED